MTPPRLIAAWLVITAQVILALAVPVTAVHGSGPHHHGHDGSRCGGHVDHVDHSLDRLACRSPAGTSVLGLPSGACDGHDHHQGEDGHAPGDRATFECCDGHSHLHVANVDDIGDGSRRWSLPPAAACEIAVAADASGGLRGFALAAERPERATRPPPSSRRALGSIVLRV
jgi:hypothetical protein